MSYKCTSCGHIFEQGEEKIITEIHSELDGAPAERFFVCPVCGEYYDETVPCRICHGEFLEDELTAEGYCMDCLRDAVTVDRFFQFATEGAEDMPPETVITLEDFVFAKIFGVYMPLQKSSPTMREWCEFIYRIHAYGKDSDEILTAILDYITELGLWSDFSEYLAEKRKGVSE